MRKEKEWFIGLTMIGKLSILAALTMGGFFAVSANNAPASPSNTSTTGAEQVKLREPKVEHKKETVEEDIPFSKTTVEDGNLAKGTKVLRTAGVNGKKILTHDITLTDGVETNRVSSESVATEPVTEVTAIGTYVAPPKVSKCDSNYSGCVPNVAYDLDCGDIGFSVNVLGYDKHGFDRDNDGYGCESY